MKQLRIGITGQSGFIGTHLYNYLSLQDNIELISFKDEYFQDEKELENFVKKCDVIVHLAAMNRHNEQEVLYKTNITLTKQLISAMEKTESTPFVLISSSTQEEKENLYGKSKRESRLLLTDWAKKCGGKFTGMIIPNVFGPFGNPYYNSFIATFSHRIANNEKPEIQIDAEIDLIYVLDLVKVIFNIIKDKIYSEAYNVKPIASAKVSDVLKTLYVFDEQYVKNGIFPDITDYFTLCLFNTFRSYLPSGHFPVKFIKHSDARGDFVEVMKYLSGGQTSYSTTKAGITRGNHFHIRKVERFAVIKGKASIKLRKYGTDEVVEYIIDGKEPAYVDMPIWCTHNITNIGDEELVTLFWINEFFDPQDPDTYFEKVR